MNGISAPLIISAPPLKLENSGTNAVGRFMDSITGPKNHNMKYFEFDALGNLDNSFMTNALTGEALYHSPREGIETATIDLTPQNLGDLSNKILEAAKGVEEATTNFKMAADSLDNIRIYSSLHNTVLIEAHLFYSWFDQQTNEMANDMKNAKNLFVKADKLP
ncbi:hypothetical protein V1498_15450 [Peribacillus sp. SCS-26]|uniref:hypothetical protein n=1 Tax=Paraperibacillus marinus TaxID=3115295 RepID=UPI00390604C1